MGHGDEIGGGQMAPPVPRIGGGRNGGGIGRPHGRCGPARRDQRAVCPVLGGDAVQPAGIGTGQGRKEALRQAQLTVLKHPERIEARRKQLGEELDKRGLKTEAPKPLPDGGKAQGRSHPALWAAFVLSGDWR